MRDRTALASASCAEDGWGTEHSTLRARSLLLSGVPLLTHLSGRFRLEIALTIAGGLRILDKIAANDWDVTQRPKLGWYDSFPLLIHAIRVWFRAYRRRAL